MSHGELESRFELLQNIPNNAATSPDEGFSLERGPLSPEPPPLVAALESASRIIANAEQSENHMLQADQKPKVSPADLAKSLKSATKSQNSTTNKHPRQGSTRRSMGVLRNSTQTPDVPKQLASCRENVVQLTRQQMTSEGRMDRLFEHLSELKAVFTQVLSAVQASTVTEQDQHEMMKSDLDQLHVAYRDMKLMYTSQNDRLEGLAKQLETSRQEHKEALAEQQRQHKQELARVVEQMQEANNTLTTQLAVVQQECGQLGQRVQELTEELADTTGKAQARAEDTAAEVCDQVSRVIEKHQVLTKQKLQELQDAQSKAQEMRPHVIPVRSLSGLESEGSAEWKLSELLRGL